MLISKKRLWLDRLETIRRFYFSPKFAAIDLCFGFIGLFMNPYRTCRKFNQKRGAPDIYTYGETPLTTYQRIAEQCGIGPQDTWMELGAGRGKGCFWLSHFVQCNVIAIEWVPQFVSFARFLKTLFRMKKVSFELKEIEKTDLSRATVIYLYGLWPTLEIPPRVKVITISEPIKNFKVLKTFWVRFPWGRTQCFYQKWEGPL